MLKKTVVGYKSYLCNLYERDFRGSAIKNSKQLLARYRNGQHQRILFSDEKIFTVEEFLINKMV